MEAERDEIAKDSPPNIRLDNTYFSRCQLALLITFFSSYKFCGEKGYENKTSFIELSTHMHNVIKDNLHIHNVKLKGICYKIEQGIKSGKLINQTHIINL